MLLDDTNHARGLHEVEADGYTLDIRIAAIFTIAAVSLIGCWLPFGVNWFGDEDSVVARLLRSFAAGIILALAFVHVLPGSFSLLASLEGAHYEALGGAIAFFAILLCTIAQSWADSTPSATLPTTDVVVVPSTCVICSSKPSTPPTKSMELTLEEQRRRRTVAHFMEFGCLVHSVIIGVDLGVNVHDRTQAIALFIALCFHQFLEGIALSATVRRARFEHWKAVLMVASYSLTVPTGIAIGMAVAAGYEEGGQVQVGITGVFDALAGGLLAYIGFVNLIVPEFIDKPAPGAPPVPASARLLTYLALALGGGFMCILAYWA